MLPGCLAFIFYTLSQENEETSENALVMNIKKTNKLDIGC